MTDEDLDMLIPALGPRRRIAYILQKRIRSTPSLQESVGSNSSEMTELEAEFNFPYKLKNSMLEFTLKGERRHVVQWICVFRAVKDSYIASASDIKNFLPVIGPSDDMLLAESNVENSTSDQQQFHDSAFSYQAISEAISGDKTPSPKNFYPLPTASAYGTIQSTPTYCNSNTVEIENKSEWILPFVFGLFMGIIFGVFGGCCIYFQDPKQKTNYRNGWMVGFVIWLIVFFVVLFTTGIIL